MIMKILDYQIDKCMVLILDIINEISNEEDDLIITTSIFRCFQDISEELDLDIKFGDVNYFSSFGYMAIHYLIEITKLIWMFFYNKENYDNEEEHNYFRKVLKREISYYAKHYGDIID